MKLSFKYKLLVLILLIGAKISAQLSHGGYPLELSKLKSNSVSQLAVIKMPAFDLNEELQKHSSDSMLKNLKFAHSFEVHLNPENSGVWSTVESYRVWQLSIGSDSAKSIGIIFTQFHLPEGARLFIFDPEKQVVLGAFTAQNNKPYKKLAIYPLPGDQLIVQYEEPINASFRAELEIGKINHDYIGIVPLKNRWVRRTSGDCNVDINCSPSGFDLQKRAVCRIIANDELGTATFINNTANDGKPYLISAFHVFDENEIAEITLFDFNYESPFCTGIDGYDSQTISGATAIASYQKLDFILVELSEMPPASFRPYYAGWDINHFPAENSYTIHHPNGDTKKISHDEGICDSFIFSSDYVNYSHWKVENWESGTTEGGSSGCALLNSEKRIVGTLTGGYASCTKLLHDAFARLDKMWNYSAVSNQQLKKWLDPINSGVKSIDGYDPYINFNDECTAFSNFMVEDNLKPLGVEVGTIGITEVAECYSQLVEGVITGVAIGINDYKASTPGAVLGIRIYGDAENPEQPIQQYNFEMNGITRHAMNYFKFEDELYIKGKFYVSVVVAEIEDSVFLYQSNFRQLANVNTMWVKENGVWKNASEYSGINLGASLLIQPTACRAVFTQKIDTLDENNDLLKLYPVPANNLITIEFVEPESINELFIYDMLGKLLFSADFQNRKYTEVDVSDFLPGIYLVNLLTNGDHQTQRFIVNR